MLKRRLKGKMLAPLIILLMTVCVSAFAGLRDESWTVNPSAFRYDMSLYFRMDNEDFEDLSSFEIGAFVDDECRGIAEKIELTQGESCLYMRIRSNSAEGEKLSFYMKDRKTGQIVLVKGEDGSELTFKADTRVGMPSNPFVMSPYYSAVFKIDGEVYKTLEIGFGDPIVVPEVPEREGYTFNGWGDVPATMPAYDIEFHSTYTVTEYTLTFKVGEDVIYSDKVAFGSSIIAPDVPAKEGYSFNGWGEVPEVMPAKDLEFTGSYSVLSYNVVYIIDGETVHTVQVAYGSPVPAYDVVPEKTGYSFSGWSDVPETMPAHDVEVNGSFAVNRYTVTFRIGDEVFVSQELAYNEEIIVPEAPAKEGYTFSGWGSVPAEMPAENLEFKGDYSINSYTVVFRIDQDVFQTLNLEYGAAIVAPEAPEMEGHTFSGWGEVPAVMPAYDLVFVGTYADNYYTITFKVGDEVIKMADLAYGSEIVLPEVPEKEGHTFSGWSNVPATMPASNVEIVGSYSVNSYKLTFQIDGEVVFTGELPYGSEIVAPEAQAREGYTFSGWGVVPATVPASDLVISGTYQVNMYTLSFLIDGEVYATTLVPYGSEISVPEIPAKEGYTLVGWSDVPVAMPACDLNIDGTYVVCSYQLTFKIDDEVIFSGQLPYGSEVSAPQAPEKTGYTFSGWGMVPPTMPASDLEISGSYAVNIYNLTFMVDEDVIYSTTLEYGSEIVAPVVPDKEGNSFSGWGDVPAVMPANDLVINGTYSVNSYTLTFRVGDEVIITGEVPYGSAITVPEVAEKEGHTFSGWGDVPATMPASNVEIVGSYSVNSYKLTFQIDGEVVFTGDFPYGSEIVAPEAQAREGYTFSGWGVVPATIPASDLVISGTYQVNSYALSFLIDGEVYATTLVPYGSEISVPEIPAKEGYSFVGWSDVPATMPAYDLNIDGTYVVCSYQLTFKIDDEVIFSGQLPYGSEVSAPQAPEKTGYTFSGWGMVPPTMPASDLEISGSYAVNVYNLTFMVDEDVIYSTTLEYGSEIVAPVVPDKEGNSFSGWGDVPAVMPANDLVINGTYSVNSYTLTFRIGDEVIITGEVPYGSPITTPDAPAKEGYTFSGWGDVPTTMPARNLECIGAYAINHYSLVFSIDDEVIYEGEVAFGAEIVVPEVPDKEGYAFSGWGVVPNVMPAHDLVITGTYERNSFAVVFKIDDEVFYSTQLPYGSEIAVPDVPEREGYTFSGWGDVPSVMPGMDLEFKGSYKVNVYTITYMIGDRVICEYVYDYGSEIAVPEVEEIEGYTFSGWGMVPMTMPACDLVFTGTYNVNYYNLTFLVNDEVVYSSLAAFGSRIIAPKVKIEEDYEFSGWSIFPRTMPAHDVVVTATLTYVGSSVEALAGEDGRITVVTLDGVILYKNADASEIKSRLAPGLYIINGKKVMVKAS